MALAVTHSTVTGAAADTTALVDGVAWDAAHTLTGAASPAQGGTGVANNVASTITISGSFGTTFTISAETSLTLPVSGTLATLAGTETLTNKTLTSPTLVTPALGTPASGVVTNLTGTASININGTVGATTPNTVAATTLTATSAAIGGTAGTGYVELPTQSVAAAPGAAGTLRVYVDPSERYAIRNASGFAAGFSLASLTASRNFTLPDVAGTIAVGSKVATVTKQVFTASGTYTPSAGMLFCVIECAGAGGGGGSSAGTAGQIYSGAGGGSGGYSRLVATAATIGASQAVTIGAAGAGGAAGSNNGAAGGDTSVGTICIGKGGSGGKYGSSAQVPTAGAGGVAGTGDLTAAGTAGLPGFYNSANATIAFPSGNGGSSYFGGGAQGVNVASAATAGVNGGNYGAGGSGANSVNIAANAAGGNGSAGVVFITEYCSQ